MTRSKNLLLAPFWIVFGASAMLATIVLRSEPVRTPANLAGQPAHLSAPVQVSSEAPAANQTSGGPAQTRRMVSASQPVPVKAAQPSAPQAPAKACRTGGPGPTMHPMCVTEGQVLIGS